MRNIIENISFFRNATFIEEITAGWSNDKKYLFEINSRKVLARIRETDDATYKRKHQIISQLNIADHRMPKLLYSEYRDGFQVFVFEWLNGQPLLDVISTYSENEQYKLGLQAGKTLRNIHSIKSNQDEPKWEDRYNAKVERVLKNYIGNYHFEGDHHVIKYIEENIDLVNGIESVLQHGDFHMGNMIVEDQELFIIDLDRCDYGCGIEEYNRYYFTSEASKHFALGQIHGYDPIEVVEFFKLVKLYVAVNTLCTFIWAEKFGEAELNSSKFYAKYVLEQYNNFKSPFPKWFKEVA